MPKTHLKIIGIGLFILILAEASKPDTQDQTLALAKRSLLQREREFIKTQPMSQDLLSFIERYKRKSQDKKDSKGKDTREKRSQQFDENMLYIIQNGQLVPFRALKGLKRSDEDEKKPEPEGFTVVPLIIPINLKTDGKLVKTRMLDEEAQGAGAGNNFEALVSLEGTTAASLRLEKLEKGEKSEKAEKKGNEEAEVSLDDEDNGNKTKEETQVLHKILQDVEGLMQSRHEGNKKEGVMCNLNGSWISDAAGMRFDINYQNSNRKKFRIHIADRIPPNEDGFLCDGNWTLFGELPFIHSSIVIVLAVHEKDKHIATFIGECRICEGSESVTGTWLIGRSSRDCKDQKASHKILSDVWRREQGHTLRKKHLQQIGFSVKDED